jgi:hypothetical protein
MSHVVETAPCIKRLDALRRAANRLGLEMTVAKAGETMTYRTWATDHGSFAGRGQNEPPLPPDAGIGAIAVLAIKEPRRSELAMKHHGLPYEIGVRPDPSHSGACSLTMDYFCEGYGMEEVIGPTTAVEGQPIEIGPKLMAMYQLALAEMTAEEQGQTYESTVNAETGACKIKVYQ